MRKQTSHFALRIPAALAAHGALGFSALMVATDAPNNQILSRHLRRLHREGRVDRQILPTFPPRVLYRLTDKSGDRADE
jgi:DNA-binding HxlR family transcriptional regulator